MSAIDRLKLKLAAGDNDADESSENEPKEGTSADLTEDMQEALDDLQEAVTSVKAAFAEFKKQQGNK